MPAPTLAEVSIAAVAEAIGVSPDFINLDWDRPLADRPSISFFIHRGHLVAVRDEEYIAVKNVSEVECIYVHRSPVAFRHALQEYKAIGHKHNSYSALMYRIITDLCFQNGARHVSIYDPDSIDVIKKFIA
jgi:hypothetical protein